MKAVLLLSLVACTTHPTRYKVTTTTTTYLTAIKPIKVIRSVKYKAKPVKPLRSPDIASHCRSMLNKGEL